MYADGSSRFNSAASSSTHRSPSPPKFEEHARTEAPWWNGAPPPSSKSGKKAASYIPYSLQTVTKQAGGNQAITAQCVEFFPYVGPKRPKGTLQRREWDRWENAAAYCVGEKVIIGRCVDSNSGACWKPIWQFSVKRVSIPLYSPIDLTLSKPTPEPKAQPERPTEQLYHVTWSINPFTLDPVVIAGGKLGLIYVLDPVDRTLVRILRGHGDDVQALAVCPSMPHILASGSRDHTTRIWNLYGHEVELAPGELPHQNYPMGDADEGNHIVAILCGNWPGGHRDDVCTVVCRPTPSRPDRADQQAWHPSHRAIATASTDQSFKIWALPELPRPVVAKPDRNYRPILVSSPLFSTNRIGSDAVDSIHWLNDDILVARTLNAVTTFHWLGYRRYFERGTWEPLGQTTMPVLEPAHWHDVNDSRSLMILSTLKTNGTYTYCRSGFHAAFIPTPSETPTFASSPNLVQGFLVAAPQIARFPEIVIFAPALAPPDPTPELNNNRRVDLEDFSDPDGEDGEENEEEVSEAERRRVTPKKRRANGSEHASGPKTLKRSREASDLDSVLDSDVDSSADSDSSSEAPWPKEYQWVLRANVWEKIVKKHNRDAAKGTYLLPMYSKKDEISLVQCCAISPRGAKWILGVGVAESLFIWRLKDA